MRVIFIITGLSSGQEDGEGGDNAEHKGCVDADVDTKLALLMESKIGQTLETLASSLPNIQVSLARAILRGGGLLAGLADRWRAAIAGGVLDSGWRIAPGDGVKHAGAGDAVVEGSGAMCRNGNGAGRQGEGVSYLIHLTSTLVLEIPHGCRQATFRFRSSTGSVPHRCDAWGQIEADPFETEKPLKLIDCGENDAKWAPLRPRGGSKTGGGSNGRGGSVIGDWALSHDRGRILLSTAGADLYLTRQGGAVFLPSTRRGSPEGVMIMDGWARRVPRNLARESLFLSP